MPPPVVLEPVLTANAREVLQARYLRREERGGLETPGQLFERVASRVAAVESRYGGRPEETAERFCRAMTSLEFLPNSPTLMNAGLRHEQLAACFVLPLDDSLGGIFDALRNTALIQQTGGGVGYDFSPLRPRGDPVTSTGGTSSGPVSFMKVFDASTDAIRHGGRRRGASMAVLSVYHPDIEEFITAKRDPAVLRTFNLSVACDDPFMEAVRQDRAISLVNPRTGQTTRQPGARALFDLMAASAWETGEPGVIFIDRINRDNPTPELGRITATNPCGEVPLLPYEACVLGSINLARLTGGGSLDWPRLGELVDLGVRFLDDCIDASMFPVPQITAAAAANRKVGLGVMGFADALVDLGIPYDDESCLRLADQVMGFIADRAVLSSRALAGSRGAFPNFGRSLYAAAGAPQIRNATRTAIAPTGSLSLIAGCSSGIEPFYALAFRRQALDGRTLMEVNRRFEEHVRAAAAGPEIHHRALHEGHIRDDASAPAALRRLFPTAPEIAPEWHIRVQAAFQTHVDNAVSKTINLPERATIDDVRRAFESAYEHRCKGITVYREGSRAGQVLATMATRADACPECGLDLEFAEGTTLCRACGFSDGA
jgi:ribonucleoside-diphosphate reductase alpha chain